jgi:outer membrane lipoprotein-sorting protein
MRSVRTLLAVTVITLATAAPAAAQQPPNAAIVDLVRRSDHVLRGRTTAAVLHMDIHTGSYDRHYSLVYWEDDPANAALVKILGPALWRGHGTLKVGNRLTVYDPSTDRMTVLSSSMLGDSWMGSHFNNDDFVKDTDLARDYTARETGSHAGTSPDGHAATFHDIELRPTPHAPVAWDHIEASLYVEGSAVVPVRMAYFQHAADKAAYRTLTFSDVKTIGGRFAPTVLTMTVASKPGEWTRLTYDDVRFDVAIPTSKFTEQALRQ